MVFPKKGDWSEEHLDRYSTEEEALEGHDNIVKVYNKDK